VSCGRRNHSCTISAQSAQGFDHFDDEECKKRFRLTKSTVTKLLEQVGIPAGCAAPQSFLFLSILVYVTLLLQHQRLPASVCLQPSHGHTTVCVVRATRECELTPLTTPTPLNRQSPNIAHVITSTISLDMPRLVKIAPGVTSPHIAKVITQFFCFFLCTQNLSTDLELRPLNRF